MEDRTLDQALRPSKWEEYIGQEKVKTNLKILIEAAKKRSEPIDHLLLYGPAGLGKTTLAYIIAREMGANIRITSGPAIEKVGDLASILTNLSAGDILFIDEAHRLNKTVEEILYPAMENRMLHIIIGKGPSARTLQLDLPPFSLIAATTRVGLLSNPLRSRFGVTFRLDFYGVNDIEDILNVTKAQKETINSYKKLSDAYKDSLQMSILEELLKEKSKNEKTSLEKENYENKGLVRKFFETIKKFKR